MMRTLGFVDRLIAEFDTALRTIIPPAHRASSRVSPAQGVAETALTPSEKKHSAGLMRVNHAGEVCAQALYQGQALTAKLAVIKEQMTQAALDELDHLAWCEQRLRELESHPSTLNILWYSGALTLGVLAGLAGDKVSLGFVAETEKQVSAHLQSHLNVLAAQDEKTQVILRHMQEDEAFHAQTALSAGGVELPEGIKQLMSVVASIMTKTSYHI
jgi:ubiquinone biosynthesis monooxygenase Coq7